MSVLIALAALAVIGWNVFVQVAARQQVSISTRHDITSARNAVAALFGPTWTRVHGKGDDNYRPKLRTHAPVLSFSYGENGAGGVDVDVWCSQFTTKYGAMGHAQLMWRKKRAAARLLAQTMPDAGPSMVNQRAGNQQTAKEQTLRQFHS